MRGFLASILIVVLAGLTPGLAFAAASGTAKGVDPEASATLNKALRTLVVGSDIFIGDMLTTGPEGQVQIKFSDGTELVVGPNSSMIVGDYLLRNDGSNGKLVIDALAGSFRFVTGRAAKDRYLIETPGGTIGVRGTAFDLWVGLNGLARVLLYHGSTILCSDDTDKCVVLTKTCELGEITDLDSLIIGQTDSILGDDRAALRAQFIYSESQRPLLGEFWVQQAYRCLHRGAEPVVQEDKPEPPKRTNRGNYLIN